MAPQPSHAHQDSRRRHPLASATDEPADEASPRRGGVLLFAAGLLFAGAGVALATAPEFSWQLVKVGRTLDAYGVDSGLLVLAGLVFLGQGAVARAASRGARGGRAPRDEANSRIELVLEQVAADLGMVRSAVLQNAEELATVTQRQEGLEVAVSALSRSDDSQERDALFRLAASLDQLNARLDERVHSLAAQLQERVGSLESDIQEARRALEERLGDLASRAQHAAPPAGPAAGRTAPGTTSFEPEPPRTAPPTQTVKSRAFDKDDELHVVVDLDEDFDDGDDGSDDDANLEFFHTVEDLNALVESSGKGVGLDVPTIDFDAGDDPEPPFPASQSPEDALDSLLPDERFRRPE